MDDFPAKALSVFGGKDPKAYAIDTSSEERLMFVDIDPTDKQDFRANYKRKSLIEQEHRLMLAILIDAFRVLRLKPKGWQEAHQWLFDDNGETFGVKNICEELKIDLRLLRRKLASDEISKVRRFMTSGALVGVPHPTYTRKRMPHAGDRHGKMQIRS